jgi:predicted nucleic acid-binding protein
MRDWVFVDTCIWASFFSKPSSHEKKAVDALIDLDRVALIGPILAEVLMGFRRDNQAQWVASRLRSAHYVDLGGADWEAAASLGRRLSAAGYKLPLTDLALAVVAQRLDAAVYSTDPDFDVIPNLKRHITQ